MGVNMPELICPLCGENNIKSVGKPQVSELAGKFIRNDYNVCQCKSCQFYFVFPRIEFTQDEWSQLYGSEYFAPMTKWWEKKRRKHRVKRLNMMQSNHDGPVEKFLDVGCGEGLIMLQAQQMGWDVYGVDIYDNRIDKAKGEMFHFTLGNLLEVSYPDDYFDAIYMDSVLEHVLNPVEYLSEINRILKPGGVLYIGVPNENSLFNDFRQIVFKLRGGGISARIKPFKAPYHVGGFTRKSLKTIIRRCDLSLLRFSNFGGIYEWRKYKAFSRVFLIHFILIPLQLLAIFMRKSGYFDVIVKK